MKKLISLFIFSCYRILSFVSINCIDKINFKNFVDLNYWSSRNGGFEMGCRQEYYCKVKEIGVTVQGKYLKVELKIW